jgi:hypothetical protein
MCQRSIFLVSLVLTVFLVVASASGVEIPVPSADFDDHVLNNQGDYVYIGDPTYTGAWKNDIGADGAYVDYRYWLSDGDLPARSGEFKAYPSDAELFDYIYQILDETFIEGATYTLSVWVGNAWPAQGYADGWALYFTGEDYNINLTEAHGLALADDWEQISLAYTATAADAGKKIGIKMSGEEGESYIVFDDVTLSYDVLASNPNPAHEQTDVPRDVILGWDAGGLAAQTNGQRIYFGENADEVTNATGAAGQTETSYDPGILTYGQTYYWRADQVENGSTVYAGDVWSFTVEAFSVPVETITATASAFSPGLEVSKTIDGSGLNALDQHSTAAVDMWFSGAGAGPVWIQYEFDQAYKLHEMLVWNSNQIIEAMVGFGPKEVWVEISLDGITWRALEDVPEFAQASGSADYSANTTVDFAGALAKYVKLTMVSGYGLTGQFGLSEVRFLYIPTYARQPQPNDGAVDVPLDAVLSWRAGREAVSHEIYLGTDPDALTLLTTTPETSYAPTDLNYDVTYFWKIAEVNDAEDPVAYAGPAWSFVTSAYTVVDNFDQYDDNCNRIFFAWLDGLGHNGSETCAVAPYNGNGTGSIVGNAAPPFAERTIVHGGSTQSMPIAYDNSTSSSEIVVNTDDLAIGRDWTIGSPTTLTMWFYGDPNNAAAQLYVKIGNTKIDYAGEADALITPTWIQWDIDLAGISLSNVPTLAIGLDRISGGVGIVYIDDVRLYGTAPEIAATVQINGVFKYRSDHPGVAWYVHATDDASTGSWLDDGCSG